MVLPPHLCCMGHFNMAESEAQVRCLWEAPIMIENIPLHLKGVARFRIFIGLIHAMRSACNVTPCRSHGLHTYGKRMCQIRKINMLHKIRLFTMQVSHTHGVRHGHSSSFKRRKRWLKYLLHRVLSLPHLLIDIALL